MKKKKKADGLSRRDFLFGGVRKLRERIDKDATPEKQDFKVLAHATEGVTQSDAEEAKAAFVRGNESYAIAEYEEAIPEYRSCIRLFPAHLEARKRLGYCLYRTEKYIQAKVEFQRVIKEAKKDNYCSLYLGLTFARMGKAEQAAKAWKEYFNKEEVRIMRELNVQIAMIETMKDLPMDDIADQVEETIELRKEELLEEAAGE